MEYALDGWDRKFSYVVDGTNICTTDACTAKQYSNNEGKLIVQTTSKGGTNETEDAVYVLISHGANGYGSYLPSGHHITQLGDPDEQANINTAGPLDFGKLI